MPTKNSRIPDVPRVISPSPTPSEAGNKDGYFPPSTRSQTARKSLVEPLATPSANEAEDDPQLARARSRKRVSIQDRESMKLADGVVATGANMSSTDGVSTDTARRRKDGELKKDSATKNGAANGDTNGFLSPTSALGGGFGASYWRSLSRSPSPLGLIPIHREWRAFIHKHEVPRKVLHVSIGFLTLWLYVSGAQLSQIHPILLGLLIPIFSVDIIRFRWPAFNRVYIRFLGPFMRESEAHDRFNGVISYLGGLWFTMRFCQKDVAVMSVLLLSWCDTAASTFGRLLGKYTPRVRRGKSLAGSIAAFVFGVGSALLFWGMVAPWTNHVYDTEGNSFAFQGSLTLPPVAREYLSWSVEKATVSGGWALAILSTISGVVASVSEAVDLWSLDDNLTIPVLSGIGLGLVLKVLGGSG